MHLTHTPIAVASAAAQTGSALPQKGQGTGQRVSLPGVLETGKECGVMVCNGCNVSTSLHRCRSSLCIPDRSAVRQHMILCISVSSGRLKNSARNLHQCMVEVVRSMP